MLWVLFICSWCEALRYYRRPSVVWAADPSPAAHSSSWTHDIPFPLSFLSVSSWSYRYILQLSRKKRYVLSVLCLWRRPSNTIYTGDHYTLIATDSVFFFFLKKEHQVFSVEQKVSDCVQVISKTVCLLTERDVEDMKGQGWKEMGVLLMTTKGKQIKKRTSRSRMSQQNGSRQLISTQTMVVKKCDPNDFSVLTISECNWFNCFHIFHLYSFHFFSKITMTVLSLLFHCRPN